MATEKIIMDAFQKAGKALTAKELAEISGTDKSEVDKVLKQLKKDGKISSPRRCYYEPV